MTERYYEEIGDKTIEEIATAHFFRDGVKHLEDYYRSCWEQCLIHGYYSRQQLKKDRVDLEYLLVKETRNGNKEYMEPVEWMLNLIRRRLLKIPYN